MRETTLVRLDSCRRLEPIAARMLGTRGYMVTGSVATDETDEISDIDQALYYDELPSEAQLEEFRQAVGGSERILYQYDVAEGYALDIYRVNGFRHDFSHARIPTSQKHIDEVLVEHKADSVLQKVVSGIQKGVALSGQDFIGEWKQAIATYPEPLRVNMVKHYMSYTPRYVTTEMAAKRGDYVFCYERVVANANNLLCVLMGLNRIYHWGEFKRMATTLPKLEIAPERLLERIQGVFLGHPLDGAETMNGLIDDLFPIVEKELPEFDTKAVQARFNIQQS